MLRRSKLQKPAALPDGRLETPNLQQPPNLSSGHQKQPQATVDAYDYYLRGLALFHRITIEENNEALRLFKIAISLDPLFALAYARAAYCFIFRKMKKGWMNDRTKEIDEAARLARRAVELGGDDAIVLSLSGMTLAVVLEELDDGAALIDRSLALNSNLAEIWGRSAAVKAYIGEPETAIEHAATAMKLSPLDSAIYTWLFYTALAQFFVGRYAEALSAADKGLRLQPNHGGLLRIVAASNALAGREAEARSAAMRLQQSDPLLRVSNLGDVLPPFRRAVDRARIAEGLRKAGLPE